MFSANRQQRNRHFRPALGMLEERALLSAMPMHSAPVAADVQHVNQGPAITLLNKVASHGFTFTNFNGPNAGTNAAAGTNMNGISNTGISVGFDIDNNGGFHNFLTNPLRSNKATELNINGSTTAMAFGVNAEGLVVGTDGNGNAFFLHGNQVSTFIPPGGTSAVAFGINDFNTIVGQYTVGNATPGFVRLGANKYITINAPSGPNIVNAQSINDFGQIVGFYVGTDGQDHGFTASIRDAKNGVITAKPIADPTIPTVAGEPGATFVFSQVLGINVEGIAVGYYGDSTTSQHGFLYNTHTGQYTFLDDPSEAFSNGVEVTQITGITNSGEITGFYSDANGVFHGFVATSPFQS
jgi:hypothetical protein